MIPKCEHIYYLGSLPQIIILVLLLTVKASAKVRDWGVRRQKKHPRRKVPLALGQTEKNPIVLVSKSLDKTVTYFSQFRGGFFKTKYPKILNLLIQCVESEFLQSNGLGKKGNFTLWEALLFSSGKQEKDTCTTLHFFLNQLIFHLMFPGSQPVSISQPSLLQGCCNLPATDGIQEDLGCWEMWDGIHSTKSHLVPAIPSKVKERNKHFQGVIYEFQSIKQIKCIVQYHCIIICWWSGEVRTANSHL